MSKENVASFVRMVAEKRDLNKLASAARNTKGWVELGREQGLEFNEKELVEFVGEILGKPVNADNAVLEFTRAMKGDELADDQLESVAGGVLTFSNNLSRSLIRAGYKPPGGDSAEYHAFPDPVGGSY